MLVGGEAGLGKSRLIAEAAAYASSHGYRVLTGASFPQDRASPFAPIVDLLRATLANLPPDDAARLARPFARELATLVPDLVPTPRGPAGHPDDADPERDRRQLFVALAHCLVGGSPSPPGPICLIVEDLHWCDEASLDFLAFLARGQGRPAGRLPLLLLATYRAEDAAPGLRAWLAQLDRARLVEEITLTPLSRDETFQLLTATFGGAQLPVGLVDAIHELAEGNPFRIEELVGALVAAGEAHPDPGPTGEGGVWRWNARPVHEWRLPRSLYEAVRERLAGVGPPARELLTLAAVVGRRFDFELLQRLAQVDERTLLTLVKELVAAGLVIEESPDRFAFRHALTRQAVYGELLARERLALHRTVAEISEQLYAEALDRHVDDLAYHFSEANAWPKALTYARRAADRARLLYAPRASMAHLSRAIEACGHLPEAQPGTLAVLHLERARANDTVGDAPAAIADARVSLDFAHQAGDQRAEWQALIDLGLFWAGRDYARAGPCFDAALDLARSLGDPTLEAHSLNRLGNWRVNAEQPRDALPYHHEALAIFERLGDRAGIAATLDLLGMAAYICADLASSMRYYERAAVLMEELDDRLGLVTCLALLASRGGSYELGSATTDAEDFAAALRDGERAVTLAREIDWPAGEAFALAQLASTLGMLGEYRPALEVADRARAIARSIDHVQWGIAAHAILGALKLDLLAFEQARTHFERALELARRIRSEFWGQVVTGELAWTHIQAGDLDLAAALLAPHSPAEDSRSFASPGSGGVDPLPCPSEGEGQGRRSAPVSSLGERWVVFAHAYLAVARNDPERALRLFDRVTAPSIEPATDDGAPAPPRPTLTPRPALGRALALSELGRTEEAEALLLGVREIVRRQGARSILWRVQVALGNLHDRAGRTEDAQPAYLAARQIVESFAAELPDPELRDILMRRTLAMLPRAYRPVTRPAPGANRPGGLTARECDVAALIADGRTNREIADLLVLGERTIETHVSNILGKLDVPSRRDIARWASAHGLTG
jgi:DNA-binding CsgD family transcriptional regulator